MAAEGEEDMPRDAKTAKELLRSMNVVDYEPRVIHQILDLWYRYIADVLTDAEMYSEHAEKPTVDSEDIKLAIQSKVNFSFSQPPPPEVLMELARSRNKVQLPKSLLGSGIPLPPEQHTLISPNYQLAIPKRQSSQPIEETEEDEAAAIPPNPNQNPTHDQGGSSQGTPQRISFPIGARDPI